MPSSQEEGCLQQTWGNTSILASLGDETDGGINLKFDKAPFLLLTSSTLGYFSCSTAVQQVFCYSTKLVVLPPWISNLVYFIYLCFGHLFTISTLGLWLSLFWGLCTPYFGVPFHLPNPVTFVPPYSQDVFAPLYSWGAILVYPNSGVSILWLCISLCLVNPLV